MRREKIGQATGKRERQLEAEDASDRSCYRRGICSFAVLSLLLAPVGLYGVLSYLMTQRTTELGIRIALGAQREQVLWLMLLDGLRPAVFGLLLGMFASASVTRVIGSFLHGVKPLDPAVFGFVAVTLLTVAIFACIAPAWRASRLDPMNALRTE